jgi:hypothetical protein
MKKIITTLILASTLSTLVYANDSETISDVTELVFVSSLLTSSTIDEELQKREILVAAIEQSEIAGSMTPVLKSFVDAVKLTASLDGVAMSDAEALLVLEVKIVK